jgi:hypothetical protein
MGGGFRRGITAKLPHVNDGDELKRHLTIAALAATGALIVWWIFHGVYENLTISAKAVGYVDSTTQAGIDSGYLVMLAITAFLAVIALRSAFICVRLLLRRHR